MFLRCERFNPKPAAERIVLHFTSKKLIFGSPDEKNTINENTSTTANNNNNHRKNNIHVLARPIVMSDLNENDMAVLQSGFMQILPQRDAAGRIVLCYATNRINEEMFQKYGFDTVVRASVPLFLLWIFLYLGLSYFFVKKRTKRFF